MTNQSRQSDEPAGILCPKRCDRELLEAARIVFQRADPILIPLRDEFGAKDIVHVPGGGGFVQDPDDWEVISGRARLTVVRDGYGYDGIRTRIDGRLEVVARGNVRVDRTGTVWRYVPEPRSLENMSPETGINCFGLGPPRPDPRPISELLSIFFAWDAPPWGWYRIGTVDGVVTPYPNAPVFPNGLRSADPHAPTYWGILPAPPSDGS